MTWVHALPSMLIIAVLAAQQAPSLPEPFATPSSTNRSQVVPQPEGQTLHVPQGFSIDVWAEGFDKPRFMLQGSHGEILLADSGTDAATAAVGSRRSSGHTGAVYAIRADQPSTRKKILDNLDRPYGLAFWKNYLYVAEPQSVKRYPYDAATQTAGRGEEVVSLAGLGRGHWTRSLLFDRAGEKLYVGVGSGSNVDPGEDPRRAAINRYNPDGTGHEIFASGTRNPIGLHWYPDTDTLWAAVQERDGLGDDLPPDYLTHIQAGGFFGWPYAYIGPHEEPRLKGKRPDLVQKTLTPDLPLGAHVAVLDFTFYTGSNFPAKYRGGAFVALHGSWNRSTRVGYEVVFVPFANGKPTGAIEHFVTGWMIAPDKREVWGRPVAVLQLQDGSLLVSEDGGKKIWRISYNQSSETKTRIGEYAAGLRPRE
jgi:glucose/arabinose dehydrogenase